MQHENNVSTRTRNQQHLMFQVVSTVGSRRKLGCAWETIILTCLTADVSDRQMCEEEVISWLNIKPPGLWLSRSVDPEFSTSGSTNGSWVPQDECEMFHSKRYIHKTQPSSRSHQVSIFSFFLKSFRSWLNLWAIWPDGFCSFSDRAENVSREAPCVFTQTRISRSSSLEEAEHKQSSFMNSLCSLIRLLHTFTRLSQLTDG